MERREQNKRPIESLNPLDEEKIRELLVMFFTDKYDSNRGGNVVLHKSDYLLGVREKVILFSQQGKKYAVGYGKEEKALDKKFEAVFRGDMDPDFPTPIRYTEDFEVTEDPSLPENLRPYIQKKIKGEIKSYKLKSPHNQFRSVDQIILSNETEPLAEIWILKTWENNSGNPSRDNSKALVTYVPIPQS